VVKRRLEAGPRARGGASAGRRARARVALAATAALVGALASPPEARAQPADRRAAAHALFEQGRTLMNAGRFAEACTKLEESHQVEPAPGTLLNLADCYERIGRTASAWELFLDVAALAQGAGRAQHETLARARAGALEPKLSKLRVTVSTPAKGIAVHRDGIVLQASEWGTAFAVDPGQHVIEASAPDKWDFRIIRYVPPGAAVVTVEVPPLVDKSQPAPPPPPTAPAPTTAPATEAPTAPTLAPPTSPRASPRPEPEGASGGWREVAGYTTVGLGLVGVGAGTFFLTDYTLRANDPNGNYEWEKPASLYAFVGAGVLLGTGLYFLLSGPPAKKQPPAVAAAPGVLFAW
jgi:hypothetical protein